MAQIGSESNSEDDVAIRSEGSQFRNAQDRMQSLLVRTGGIIPGTVPKIGEQAFVKNRITKFFKTPNSSNNLDVFAEGTTYLLTGEPRDDNQSRNRAQLEKLKRQLTEKERNKDKGVPSRSPSRPLKRTEAQAELLGIIEVRTPLRNLSTERKRELAQMSATAVANETPNISEDGLELGPVIAIKKSVSVVMEGGTVSIMVANEVGGGAHEMAQHALTQIGVVVHTKYDKMLVYIGRDAMGRRTAVVLKIPGVVEFINVVAHFTINRKSKV